MHAEVDAPDEASRMALMLAAVLLDLQPGPDALAAVKRAHDAHLLDDLGVDRDGLDALAASEPPPLPPPRTMKDWADLLLGDEDDDPDPRRRRRAKRPPRKKLSKNGPCWCGSGRKYKGCHYPELPPGDA
jgi:hypothetical protein